MYLPAHFAQTRPEQLQQLMQDCPFATLSYIQAGRSEAEHLPLLYSPDSEGKGVLRGHIARANPLWRSLAADSEVLCIFHGPQQYVSPGYYPSKQLHGKVVPTWNYLIVQARGKVSWQHDPAWLLPHLDEHTALREQRQAEPWSLSDAPPGYIEQLSKAIVGIEIDVCQLVGKWKLSQNKNTGDHAGVMQGLQDSGSETARAVADWMQQEMHKRSPD